LNSTVLSQDLEQVWETDLAGFLTEILVDGLDMIETPSDCLAG
jgi:hypothetical protein